MNILMKKRKDSYIIISFKTIKKHSYYIYFIAIPHLLMCMFILKLNNTKKILFRPHYKHVKSDRDRIHDERPHSNYCFYTVFLKSFTLTYQPHIWKISHILMMWSVNWSDCSDDMWNTSLVIIFSYIH